MSLREAVVVLSQRENRRELWDGLGLLALFIFFFIILPLLLK